MDTIMLYALFPLIAYVESKRPWSIIVLLPASAVLAFVRCKYLMPISSYLFPFVVGTALGSKYVTHRFPVVYKLMGGGTSMAGIAVLCLLLASVMFMRIIFSYTFLWDTLITILIVLIYKSVRLSDYVNLGLEFLGRHSFNIFLFHTFIYAYFFPALIYWNRNPVVIFFTLLLSCIVISIGIDKLKRLTGVDRI